MRPLWRVMDCQVRGGQRCTRDGHAREVKVPRLVPVLFPVEEYLPRVQHVFVAAVDTVLLAAHEPPGEHTAQGGTQGGHARKKGTSRG